MTVLEINDRHTILCILDPALQFIGLRTVIVHLDAVSLRLSHADLRTFGEAWKNLKTLDLRFNIISTNEHLDIIKVTSVQAMTRPQSAEFLKRVHLPELDVRNFRNITNNHNDSLTSLTSSVLHFNSHEITDICHALLTAYPNLETVTSLGSDPKWARFAATLASIQEKRREGRADRLEWGRLAMLVEAGLANPIAQPHFKK
ncbi:hypothetical protein LXA43DRAFT_1069461 [Ganoderma leucocontextum]|nr:hypothetical protein LXA43DRAFT_1069461 [Ganoderma leucocontextum]